MARFPVLSSIGSNAFKASKLSTLILEGSTVVTLDNVNAFSGIPAVLTVYVPQNAIASYQVATNWSALYEAGSVVFTAYEGSEWE